jgi:hypothetical protein
MCGKMQLNPTNIQEHLQQLGKKEATNLLKEWICNSNEQALREQALDVLGVIDEGDKYLFFEQLFLSDANLTISLTAGKILSKKYRDHKKLLSLLQYTLEKVENIDKKLLAIEILKKIDNHTSARILKDFLIIKLRSIPEKAIGNLFTESIFKKNYQIEERLIDVCINLILYQYYIEKWGFNVTLRDGRIILLNCEGAGFKSIGEIPAIKRLVNLKHLILKRNRISKIESIQNLKDLQILDLSDNELSEIESLAYLPNLKDLILTNNKIDQIRNVNMLQNLRKLAINYNALTEIQHISGLRYLEDLNLNNNQITHISGLRDLPRLEKLNLSFNQITKISGLYRLENLHWLHLNNNRIEKIEGLANLTQLKGLYLSDNQIQKIENLENLTELRKIELSNNKILQIEGLETLQKLQELFLDNNQIEEISGLEKLRQLIILFLKSNKIRHFSKEMIEELHNLNFIFLNDNPLTPESKIYYNRRSRYP